MKQPSIEEKAKAYDEAKSIMEKYLKSGNAGVIAENTIKKAFPELEEIEDWQNPIFRVGDYIRNTKTGDKVLIEQLDMATKAYCYICYDGAAVNHSDFPFSHQYEWKLIGHSGTTVEKDMTEYKKGFEYGKQLVLKYPEDFGLCKKSDWLEKQGEIDKVAYEIAEKEKCEFVGDGFIKCYANFQDFKEGETYWLEYIGNDNYNVKSDNLLGKTYHITPCQLYTIFKKQTWLEKLGGQKPADNVEPKFKVGDWVVVTDKGVTVQIGAVNNGYYTMYNGMDFSISYVDKCWHKWTIDDAKDGDILATSAGAFIYNGNNGGGSCPGSYCGINTLGGFQTGAETHWTGKEVYPTTKEQRELLFSKMREAGYEWDAEKKELKKIEDEEYNGEDYGIDSLWYALGKVDGYQSDDGILEHKCAITAIEKLYEQKPTEWNEEDERLFNSAVWHLRNSVNNGDTEHSADQLEDWIKSLRQNLRSI